MENKVIHMFNEDKALNIEKVVDEYTGYIYSILRKSLSNQQDIEEILSDVFYIYWKNYKRINNNKNIKPYLVGIAKNLIKKKYEEYNISFEDIELYEDEIICNVNIEEVAENKEKSEIISSVLNDVKDLDRQVFIMFYYNQKKIEDIAKLLEISKSNVKIILHRVRKHIKRKLIERGYDYGR